MTENVQQNNNGLIAFQRVAWFGCVIYFAVVSVLLILGQPMALKLSQWGIILVLSAAVGQLVVMAAEFKRAGKRRFMILSYILLAVILLTAGAGAFLL